MVLICRFPGGGDIDNGKLIDPEDNTDPVPVELSKNVNL